jgi:hypothetical protein
MLSDDDTTKVYKPEQDLNNDQTNLGTTLKIDKSKF